MERIRILLADDDTLVREALRALLADVPDLAVVGEAGDAEEAVRLTHELQPDVVLLDPRMPGDGTRVVEVIRAVAPKIRVVVLTGLVSEHQARPLVRLGISGYLAKSVSTEELLRALRVVHAGGTYFAPVVAGLLIPRPGAPTDRELDVLQMIGQGLRYREIALRLSVSERTVRFHARNLRGKLEASSPADLIRLARERGWIA